VIKDNNKGFPIRSLQTMLRLISQIETEIPTVISDGIYGKNTENSVRSFQEKYNIKNTGITNNETWDKILERYEFHTKNNIDTLKLFNNFKNIELNDESVSQILIIQSMIVGISKEIDNIKNVDVNGKYDINTSNEIKEIQKISGLEQNGIIDIKTLNALMRIYYMFVVEKRVWINHTPFLPVNYINQICNICNYHCNSNSSWNMLFL